MAARHVGQSEYVSLMYSNVRGRKFWQRNDNRQVTTPSQSAPAMCLSVLACACRGLGLYPLTTTAEQARSVRFLLVSCVSVLHGCHRSGRISDEEDGPSKGRPSSERPFASHSLCTFWPAGEPEALFLRIRTGHDVLGA